MTRQEPTTDMRTMTSRLQGCANQPAIARRTCTHRERAASFMTVVVCRSSRRAPAGRKTDRSRVDDVSGSRYDADEIKRAQDPNEMPALDDQDSTSIGCDGVGGRPSDRRGDVERQGFGVHHLFDRTRT